KDEMDELELDPPKEMRRTLNALRYLESVVGASDRFEGIVLRYGALYGPGTGMLDERFAEEIRQRRFPLLGSGDGWWSFLHVEDAAKATAAAVHSIGARGIYNIVDDEPAPVRDWLPEMAHLLGAKPPRHIPLFLARMMAGEHLIYMMTEQR